MIPQATSTTTDYSADSVLALQSMIITKQTQIGGEGMAVVEYL